MRTVCTMLLLLAGLQPERPSLSTGTAHHNDTDIGGWRLHSVTDGRGSPVVVFENGMGEPLDTWKHVQPAIATLTTTFSYDRAGLGMSQAAPGSAPRDARTLADELHRLLGAADVAGP